MKELTQKLALRVLAAALLSVATGAIAMGQAAPYDLKKFRSVLKNSKLQAPKSSPTLINKGKFKGASNEYFFLDPTGQYMTFTVEGDKLSLIHI